jgi:hypothetical protein
MRIKKEAGFSYKNLFHTRSNNTFALLQGELAQLVERLHGMQEVSGSTPLFSTD